MAKRSHALNGSLDASITPEVRHRMIAEAAYYRALQRGFSGGSAEDDWVQAEQEINSTLLGSSSSSRRKPQRTGAQTQRERPSGEPKNA
jgi:Protein of unknown function (DUF2934)